MDDRDLRDRFYEVNRRLVRLEETGATKADLEAIEHIKGDLEKDLADLKDEMVNVRRSLYTTAITVTLNAIGLVGSAFLLFGGKL